MSLVSQTLFLISPTVWDASCSILVRAVCFVQGGRIETIHGRWCIALNVVATPSAVLNDTRDQVVHQLRGVSITVSNTVIICKDSDSSVKYNFFRALY